MHALIKYCITIYFHVPRNGHQTCQFWTRGRKSLISSKLYACVLNLAPPITRMKTMSQPIRFKVEHARTMMNATCMVIDGLEASIQGPHSSIRPAFFYKARIPSPKIKYIRLESFQPIQFADRGFRTRATKLFSVQTPCWRWTISFNQYRIKVGLY